MSHFKDLTGKTFGKLRVTGRVGEKNTHMVWCVVCECGSTTEVPASNLISGNTTQCINCRFRAQRKLGDSDIKKMMSLRKKGLTFQDIGELYGVSKSTVHRNIAKHKRS